MFRTFGIAAASAIMVCAGCPGLSFAGLVIRDVESRSKVGVV